MRILVIRRDNIGDLVCTTPLLASLRSRYPQARIEALVNSYNAGVLAGNPDLDAVHTYTKVKHRERGRSALRVLGQRLQLYARLRRERFDCVVLAKSGFDRHGLNTAKLLRAPRVVGFPPARGDAPRALTQPVFAPATHELHEVEVLAKLAAVLDAREPPGPLRVFAAPEQIARWRERFPALRAGRWIAVHISARERERMWPVEKFVEFIRRLQGCGVVLLWAPGPADDPRHPGDDERAAVIATSVGGNPTLIPARTAALDELIAVLSCCCAFVGADGGAMHLAAGLGKPIVALFENVESKKRHWYPWQVRHELVTGATPDVAGIRVEDVHQAYSRLAVA